jgi:paraquat-inducible protein B
MSVGIPTPGSALPPRRTEAGVRTTRWPGWIWAVPLAAVGIVTWLLIRALSGQGIGVTIVVDDASGLTANSTNVTYHGVNVGQVTGIAVANDGRHANVSISMDGNMRPYLTTATRFYLSGAQPSLTNLSSLKAILSGPTIIMIPGPGAPSRRYIGITPTPPDSVRAAARYLVYLDGPVGDLSIGAPVTFRGFTVGEVTAVHLVYDPATGAIATPVVIGLDPSRFGLGRADAEEATAVPVMNAAIDTLVREGLRARLVRNPPVIGPSQVILETVSGAPVETLGTGSAPPQIPTISSGGVQTFLAHLSDVPIEEIGENLRVVTSRVRALVSEPQLEGSIDHLDRTLASLDTTVRNVGPQLPPVIAKLGQTANELDATATSVRRVTGGSIVSPNGNLEEALRELTDAARALRTLANFLDQHPEAMIRGRSQ